MKPFLIRLMSGLILVGLVVATCWYGGLAMFLFVMAVSGIGLAEFYRVFGISMKMAPGVAGTLGMLLWFASIAPGDFMRMGSEGRWLSLVLAFMLVMAVYVFTFPRYSSRQIMASFFGLVYVPVMLSFICQTRMLENGFKLVWLIFFSAWGCDTCAYCVGSLIGKHKLAPVLSPKKSVEGAVGGVAGAALLGALYAVLVKENVLPYALICAAGAVMSQIGDLAASAFKRQHDIKDYGNLIPGHGGILDRFDSMIVTAPMIYLLAVLLAR